MKADEAHDKKSNFAERFRNEKNTYKLKIAATAFKTVYTTHYRLMCSKSLSKSSKK